MLQNGCKKKAKITFSGFPEKVNLSPSFNQRYSFDVVIFVKIYRLVPPLEVYIQMGSLKKKPR